MLPQASVTLTVHTWLLTQPTTVIAPPAAEGTLPPKPQPSVTEPAAVIAIAAVGMAAGSGLQPKLIVLLAGLPSVHNAKVGATASFVHV